MNVGRRLYFDRVTGELIVDVGERSGDVLPHDVNRDFALLPELKGKLLDDVVYTDLEFGDRKEEFTQMHKITLDVTTLSLQIQPRIRISIDKATLVADGVDEVTVNVDLPFDEILTQEVSFYVNNNGPFVVLPVNGIATLRVTTTIPGVYLIEANTVDHGRNAIEVVAVDA